MRQSPIFVKTYDFLQWLLPLTARFPKSQRFLLAERLGVAALDFYERLQRAALGEQPGSDPAATLALLNEADLLLHRQRFYLRLSHDLLFISAGQYEHAVRQMDEIGRLLGGWMRRLKEKGIPGELPP